MKQNTALKIFSSFILKLISCRNQVQDLEKSKCHYFLETEINMQFQFRRVIVGIPLYNRLHFAFQNSRGLNIFFRTT